MHDAARQPETVDGSSRRRLARGKLGRSRRALEAGGVTATVSRNPGRAVVDVEASVAPATIERAIADSGFPATLIATAS